MKRLYIVRHAKSSWADASIPDFDRPLNQRGLNDAPFMANLLKERYTLPQVIVSSPANRALTTAMFMASTFGFETGSIRIEPRLYETGVREYLEILSELADDTRAAMIVGHNPTVTELAEYLGDLPDNGLPTCAIAVFDLDIAHWSDLPGGAGVCIALEVPKNYT